MNNSYWLILLVSLLFISVETQAQVLPASCDDLVTDIDMWGDPARGVDLRDYTNSTLHWIGCPDDGCVADEFFCTFDENTQTLSFGVNTPDATLRAAVDPGNLQGDTMPDDNTAPEGCCTSEDPLFGVCNAPDSENNGIPVDAADALCFALGYESGSLTEVIDNSCPEANAINADGSNWTSDFVNSQGYGTSYTCVGFRAFPTPTPTPVPVNATVPTLSVWGLVVMAGVMGIIGYAILRRRKAAV